MHIVGAKYSVNAVTATHKIVLWDRDWGGGEGGEIYLCSIVIQVLCFPKQPVCQAANNPAAILL